MYVRSFFFGSTIKFVMSFHFCSFVVPTMHAPRKTISRHMSSNTVENARSHFFGTRQPTSVNLTSFIIVRAHIPGVSNTQLDWVCKSAIFLFCYFARLSMVEYTLRGRMNVIELDFSFGFWKEHVEYWWGFTFWTSVNNGCSWMNADYWHLGFVPVGWPGRSWQMRKSNREIST